jgi:protein arginine kinase activator
MWCEQCGKEPATVHITRILNGEVETSHLCQSCAKARGEFHFALPAPTFLLQNFLGGLTNAMQAPSGIGRDPVCPACQTPFSYFQSTGRLGCPACYEAFQAELDPLVRRLHGAERHRGHVPPTDPRLGRQAELLRLKEELEKAIAQEAYERAAELRDRIRALEAEGGAPA